MWEHSAPCWQNGPNQCNSAQSPSWTFTQLLDSCHLQEAQGPELSLIGCSIHPRGSVSLGFNIHPVMYSLGAHQRKACKLLGSKERSSLYLPLNILETERGRTSLYSATSSGQWCGLLPGAPRDPSLGSTLTLSLPTPYLVRAQTLDLCKRKHSDCGFGGRGLPLLARVSICSQAPPAWLRLDVGR